MFVRHQATVGRSSILSIGAWNVRALFLAGKLDNVEREMDRLRLDLLAVQETC